MIRQPTIPPIPKIQIPQIRIPAFRFHIENGKLVCTVYKGGGREGADGELERTTISLMQNLDTLPNNVILLAATNRPDVIDPALMRRFSQKNEVQMLSEDEAVRMVQMFFASIGQEVPYTAEETKVRYREAGSPADLMVRIVQDLAEKLAEEEIVPGSSR